MLATASRPRTVARPSFAALCVALVGLFAEVEDSRAAFPVGNLVQNPGAEADTNAAAVNIDVTGFDPETGGFTVGRYGKGTAPAVSVSNTIGGGANVFHGGSGAQSSGRQDISLAGAASQIDSGRVSYALSAFIGGYATQEDRAQLRLTFLNGGGAALSSVQIGPVSAAERGNVTTLLLRNTAGAVPTGARTARLDLEMTLATPTGNDGQADNLSFTLSGPDTDGDGTQDFSDNCPAVSNANQANLDRDEFGDACDGDSDGDTIGGAADKCPLVTAYTTNGCKGGPPIGGPAPKLPISNPKGTPLPGGGRSVTVTPSTACALSTTSKVTSKPRGSSSVVASQRRAVVSLKPFQAITLGPKQKVTVPIQPVVKLAGSTGPIPNPPPVKVSTKITCKSLLGIFSPVVGFGPPINPNVRRLAVAPVVRTTTVTVNPPKPPPPTERKVTAGDWRGKGRGTPADATTWIAFEAGSSGAIANLEGRGFEICTTPAPGRSGGSVQSPAHLAGFRFFNSGKASPTNAFPRKTPFLDTDLSRSLVYLRFGTEKDPTMTFTDENHATGTIEGVRLIDPPGSRCVLHMLFDAKPGTEPDHAPDDTYPGFQSQVG